MRKLVVADALRDEREHIELAVAQFAELVARRAPVGWEEGAQLGAKPLPRRLI